MDAIATELPGVGITSRSVQVPAKPRLRSGPPRVRSPLVEAIDGMAVLVSRFLDSHIGGRAQEELIDQLDRLLIKEALRRTNGNQTHAAQLLGLSRPTLHAKMQRHGISLAR